MDVHHLVVFTHLAAMAGFFGALAIEGVSLIFLRRATSYEQAREWTSLWRLLPLIGGPSVFVALASGIYLATAFGLWEFGWTRVAIPTVVLVAVLGGILAPHRGRLQKALNVSAGTLPPDVQQQLRRPLDMASWRVRAAILCGLVFEMTTKTDAGLLTMTPFVATGMVWGAMAWKTR